MLAVLGGAEMNIPPAEAIEWIRSRPESVQRLMIEWPPMCVVKTLPGVILLIPAPGVEGTVTSYYENGTLGVDAPMSIPHPTMGFKDRFGNDTHGEVIHAMNVDPGQLVLVREGLVTSEMVRGALA